MRVLILLHLRESGRERTCSLEKISSEIALRSRVISQPENKKKKKISSEIALRSRVISQPEKKKKKEV